MALGQIGVEKDVKRLLTRIASALEKIADGSSREQNLFQQYISGGEEGFVQEVGHNYVVRITGCDAEEAQGAMEWLVNSHILPGKIEVSKR